MLEAVDRLTPDCHGVSLSAKKYVIFADVILLNHLYAPLSKYLPTYIIRYLLVNTNTLL
jgi:hypothetical protein